MHDETNDHPTHDGRRSAGIFAALAVGIALVTAYLMATGADVSGSIEGPGWQMTADHCISGVPLGFRGVELSDGGERRVRVMQNDEGAPKVVVSQGAARTVLEGDSCSSLEVELDDGNVVSNEVRSVTGRADFACGEVSGAVRFSGCTR